MTSMRPQLILQRELHFVQLQNTVDACAHTATPG